MRKLVAILVLMLVAWSGVGMAVSNLITKGKVNGRYMLKGEEAETTAYVIGLLEGVLVHEDGIEFKTRTYPNMSVVDVRDALIHYYQNNPAQRHRPVVEVFLSGDAVK